MTRPFESVIVRTLLGPLVTAIQLFSLYVVIHGHYSPGGGFQGGVLLGASLILPMLVYGRTERSGRGLITVGVRGAAIMAAMGVLIFAAVGLYSLVLGQPMFDYSHLPLPLSEEMRRSMGILGIEVGVTLAVAGAVVAIFHVLYTDFAGEGE